MSAVRQIVEIARRDFVQRARSKTFLITTGLTVAAIFALVPLLAAEIRDPAPSVVGVTGSSPVGFPERFVTSAEALGFAAEVRQMDSVARGEAALGDGQLDALVVDGSVIVFAQETSPRLTAAINAAAGGIARDRAIADLGLTPGQAARIVDPPALVERVVRPPDPEDMPRRVGAQLGAILLYMALIIFGQFILMGVMEEKQSRVVEVILSRVRADRLLAGKILGIGLLGLCQLIVIGGALVLAVVIVDVPGVDLPSLGVGILAWTTLWFLLGFGLYAVLYGALGATVTRQEDSQGAAMLPVVLLLPGYFVSFTAIENPDGLAAVIGSLVPFSAPVVMPVRMAAGTVPWWQGASSIGLVLITTLVMIRVGGRIYRGAVLTLGPKVSIRDALRAGRTS